MPAGKVACVIPARLGSTRFPGKLLYNLNGVPVVCRTIEKAVSAGCFDEVICLTDSVEIYAAAAGLKCKTVMTGSARNGTERISLALAEIDSDLIVNLQGDEPLFPVEELKRVCEELCSRPDLVHILVYKSYDHMLLSNTNRVKVITDADGKVIDFIRQVKRDSDKAADWGVQLGIYAYGKDFLRKYGSLPPSKRELEESHELLRSPSISPVQTHFTTHHPCSLDVPEDLKLIREMMSECP